MKKKTKKKKEFNLNGYLFGAISRIWRWWPPRQAVIVRSTSTVDGVEGNTCDICKIWYPVLRGKRGRKKRQIEVDHIVPVVSVKKGFQGWDNYIKRKFVQTANLQALCKGCHSAKTKEENRKRREK